VSDRESDPAHDLWSESETCTDIKNKIRKRNLFLPIETAKKIPTMIRRNRRKLTNEIQIEKPILEQLHRKSNTDIRRNFFLTNNIDTWSDKNLIVSITNDSNFPLEYTRSQIFRQIPT